MAVQWLCGRVVSMVAVAGGLLACGSDPAPVVEPFGDGERLRARYFELEGGATLFRGFYDTALEEPCWFDGLVGPSGVDTCLPASVVTASYGEEFLDPACTERALAWYGGAGASMVAVMPSIACDTELAIYEIGERVDTRYARDSQGACVARTSGTPTYRLGPQVALDRFASARAEPELPGGRIGALTLVGADGSRQVIAGWDAARQESVVQSPEVTGDRWMPRGVSYGFGNTVFSDAACSRPVATKIGSSAYCPVTTALRNGVNQVGARLDPRALYALDGVACTPYSDDRADLMYFEIAEPIEVEAFAELAVVEQGSGRIRRRDAASPTGLAIMPIAIERSPMFDTVTDRPCEIATASDGVARCLPPTYDAGYFADAACAQPLVQVTADPGDFVTIVDEQPGADPMRVVWRVETPYSDEALYVRTASGCTSTLPPSGFSYYVLGEPVTPAAFEPAIARD